MSTFSNMQSEATCCPSPWVWINPATAIIGASQQVLMPMSAPSMMPMPEHGLPNAIGFDMRDAVPYSWSADGVWSHTGGYGYFPLENAPQQLPIEGQGSIAPMAQSDHRNELPSESNMNMMTPALACAAVAAGNLRRRRQAKAHSTEMWQNAFSPDEGAVDSFPDASTEGEYAQEFANKILMQLKSGGNERQSALAEFESLCFANKATSHAAQLALKQASSSDAAALALKLRGNVRSAVNSKYANFVLETIIASLPAAHASFIIDELKGNARKVVRTQFGCRILCRILEHLSCANDHSASELIDEILSQDVDELCRNEFGSYVARHLIEYGFAHHKQIVLDALLSDLLDTSKHKFGSHVVEAALRHSGDESQCAFARILMHDNGAFVQLADSQFGRHVARALLSMHGEIKKRAVEILLPMESKLKSMRYGKSILQPLRAAAKCIDR